jgi:hypothetical protein
MGPNQYPRQPRDGAGLAAKTLPGDRIGGPQGRDLDRHAHQPLRHLPGLRRCVAGVGEESAVTLRRLRIKKATLDRQC